MFNFNSANISKHEAVVRIFGGIVLILAVLVYSSVPPWLSLIAVYPIMSGIIQWDPLSGVFLWVRYKIHNYLCRKSKAIHRQAYTH